MVMFIDEPVDIGVTPLAHAKVPLPTAVSEMEVWVQFKTVELAAFVMLNVGKGFTTTVVVAGRAHNPRLGVKVYVVVTKLLGAGDQVPVILLVELVGSVGKAPPAQIAEMGLKVGVTFGFTTTTPLMLLVPFQAPPPVELYPPYTVQPL